MKAKDLKAGETYTYERTMRGFTRYPDALYVLSLVPETIEKPGRRYYSAPTKLEALPCAVRSHYEVEHAGNWRPFWFVPSKEARYVFETWAEWRKAQDEAQAAREVYEKTVVEKRTQREATWHALVGPLVDGLVKDGAMTLDEGKRLCAAFCGFSFYAPTQKKEPAASVELSADVLAVVAAKLDDALRALAIERRQSA